jgi:parallel beta-helix repeat protein
MSGMGLISRGIILLVILGALFGTITAAQPIKAPAVITSPGVYELSEDARGITDIYGIQIQCSNVVINGAGHFLGGEQREKSAGVFVNQYGGSITNITVKNLNLEDWESAIDYDYVKGQKGDTNLITGCDIVKCDTGIHIEYSDYVRVEENQLRECSSGLVVEEISTNIDLKKNTIKNCGVGIGITNSMQTILEENNINGCSVYGIEVTDSEGITAEKNGVSDNKYAAMRLENSKESVISGNNFSQTEVGAVLIVGNDVHNAEITDNYFSSFENVVVDDVSTDIIWNTTQKPGTNILGGPYLGGNYWGSAPGVKGYSDTAIDKDGFGIADTPYRINEYNIDYFPLTHTTATKAPEEQVGSPDGNVINTSSDIAANETSEPKVEPIQTPEKSSVPENSTTSQVLEKIIPAVKESIALNATTSPSSGSKEANTTGQVVPVKTLSTNESILNRSITNAYSADTNQSRQVSSQVYNGSVVNGTNQMIPESVNGSSGTKNANISSPTTTGESQTLPAQFGYLVFLVSEAGGHITLTTTSGSEIKLDQMQQKDLTIPVPVGGLEYTSYRVEKDGFKPVSGTISSYPGTGQTTTITVNLTNVTLNTTVQPGIQPIQNQVSLLGNNTNITNIKNSTNITSTSSNRTMPVKIDHSAINQFKTIVSNSSASNQTVQPKSTSPTVVVTNGVNQFKTSAPNSSPSNQIVQPESTSPAVVVINGVNQSKTIVSNSSTSNQTVQPANTPRAVVVINGVNQSVSALPSHIIRASAGPGGSIYPNGSVSVEDNGTSAFMIETDADHKISYLVIDGTQTSPMSDYRFMNVTTDHTIIAGFT